jgi:hypothetical protein
MNWVTSINKANQPVNLELCSIFYPRSEPIGLDELFTIKFETLTGLGHSGLKNWRQGYE